MYISTRGYVNNSHISAKTRGSSRFPISIMHISPDISTQVISTTHLYQEKLSAPTIFDLSIYKRGYRRKYSLGKLGDPKT